LLNKITFLSRIKKYISFLFIIIFSIQFVRAEDWTSAQLKGKGEITVYYYNSDNFISDASGNLSGIEYDILIAFKDYLEAKGIDITLKFKKADSFSGLYNKIKNGGSHNFCLRSIPNWDNTFASTESVLVFTFKLFVKCFDLLGNTTITGFPNRCK